jgi:hypothetical protein
MILRETCKLKRHPTMLYREIIQLRRGGDVINRNFTVFKIWYGWQKFQSEASYLLYATVL